MAVFVKISSVFFFLVFVTSIQGQGEQICLNLQREPLERPLPVTHQGPPGRRGPQGAIGPQGTRGNRGPPGQCVCDMSDVEQLGERLNDVSGRYERIEHIIRNVMEHIGRAEVCPLGIKSKRVQNADMTSSSVYSSTYSAHRGRLDGSRAWIASNPNNKRGAWIQVDMKVNTTLTGVVTQGNPSTNQWVTRYKISFGNFPDELEFVQDDDGNDMIFEGNTDKNSHVLNLFPQPITARYVKFVVWNFKSHISMRIEYVTC
ncbi:retinoschisin-like [Clavelina lepadiformis]|uniref:retinoschisin-like n=1 Tax=Clavelina lepadiformis TaxID=159417 RepID=UPI0040413D2B